VYRSSALASKATGSIAKIATKLAFRTLTNCKQIINFLFEPTLDYVIVKYRLEL
jgi:carbamoylphosphate synthase large subunit